MPSSKRTQLQRVHMTSECVRALSARNLTPRSKSPFETPVATTITSPAARSSIVNSRSRSATPDARAASTSVRDVGHSCAWSSPPRQRSAAAAGHDAPALERVEREVDFDPAGADLLARRELAFLTPGPDHDPPVDRQLLDRDPHRGRRVLLGCALVGAPEPPRARERRPLGHARVALAETEPALLAGRVGSRLGRRLRHPRTAAGCAAASTSSMTSPMASSMFPFSITRTP